MLYTHRAHNYVQKPTVVGQHLMTTVDVAECCQQLTDDRRLLIILVSSFVFSVIDDFTWVCGC